MAQGHRWEPQPVSALRGLCSVRRFWEICSKRLRENKPLPRVTSSEGGAKNGGAKGSSDLPLT